MKRSHTTKAIRSIAILVVGSLLISASPVAGQDEATPPAGFDASAKPAQTLIGERLEAGKIDYPTSLLYRAFALFADPRLPADLIGSGGRTEDHAFFVEARRFWSVLPQETRDLLTPFVVRPTDSRSRYFDGEPDAEPGATQTEAEQNPTFARGDCGEGWAFLDSSRFPFKVWMHCLGDYQNDLATAVAMIEDFWEREVALMGPPIPDTGSAEQGGDTRIDFYFVEDERDVLDRAGGDQLAEQAYAHAAPDAPFVGRTSSGYILARRAAIADPAGVLVLAHEFFHTLQEAHNWQILFGYKGSPYSSDFDTLLFAEYWFVEATANWVVSYLYRDTIDPDVLMYDLHAWYLQGFQLYDVPLYHSPRQWTDEYAHIYGAYVYFLFLEQEVGAQAIADLWIALEDVEADEFERTLTIIDELLPFREHFRDFAVRNLNLQLDPGDPISPSFKDIDPSFPEELPPPFQPGPDGSRRTTVDVTGNEPLTFDEAIPSLAAHYYTFAVARPVEHLTFDFSELAADGALDVDMIVKIRDGEWERRQLPTEEPMTLCFGNEADHVSMFYLVVSNHDLVEANTARGTFTIAAGDAECT